MTLWIALAMGVMLAAAAGATIPLPDAERAAVDTGVPIVALVNRSARDDSLFFGQFCGGVVVARRQVVTATHCLVGRPIATVDVVSGVADLCAAQHPRGWSRARVVPRSVLPHSSGTLSLLQLGANLAATNQVGNTAMAAEGVTPGSTVIGWGWGRDAVGGIPACRLRAVELEVVDPGRCDRIAAVTFERARTYESGDTSVAAASGGPFLCAVPGGESNTCTGDSGGPVTAADPVSGAPRVVAITMAGSGCGPESLGLSVLLLPTLTAGR